MSNSSVNCQGEGNRGDHKNTLTFVGRVLGQVRPNGEREREGGGGGGCTETGKTNIVDEEIQYYRQGSRYHWGGCHILQLYPSTHTHSQVLPAVQVGSGKPLSIKTLVKQPGVERHHPEVIREGIHVEGG